MPNSRRQDQSSSSIGSMIGQMIGNVQEIVRGEVVLAKQELKEEVRQASVGGGLMAGAGVMALVGAIFAGQTLANILSLILPRWVASLVVTVIYLAGGGYLFQIGRQRLKQVEPVPQQTIASLKEDRVVLEHQVRSAVQPQD